MSRILTHMNGEELSYLAKGMASLLKAAEANKTIKLCLMVAGYTTWLSVQCAWCQFTSW